MILPFKKDNCCIFDFDSTLVSLETLDFLIEKSGVSAEEIKIITDKAMGGKMSFFESLSKRFEKINLNRKDISRLRLEIVDFITEGVREFLKTLEDSHDFYIISGGFLEIIYPVADELGIARSNCFANDFVYEGEKIIGFNANNLLSQDGGKVKVAKEKIIGPNNYKNIFMIGDGYTDFEVSKSIKEVIFCGFGGHVVREIVQKEAKNFFFDFIKILSFISEKTR
ncbi:MAG: HAD-IB family phosphatase [Rickettsiales bacterium]|nr:HAD-IB family phosphatase [Rickettsiales bacterium]